jgi:hypothetical protein
VAGACGPAGEPVQPVAQDSPPSTSPPTTSPGLALPLTPPASRPPPIILRAGGTETTLAIWSACWSSGNANGCADGHPPDVAPDIGGPPEVEVAFDAPGWRFSATAMPTADTCSGRQETADLTATGATTHRLLPMGRAGDYTITLSGRSTDAATNKGDVATTFRWHTPRNGPSAPPTATMGLLATPPEIKASLGAELTAQSLGVSTTAAAVSASAVVTAASGEAMTVEFHRHPGLECVPDGFLFLRSDGEDGRRLTALGPSPFRYDITLTIAGTTYRGAGTWPQDQIHDCAPCTKLRWDPPLPAR